jgi:hypothetical protein
VFSSSTRAAQQVFSGLRNDPAFDAVNQFRTSANSTYNGATVTLNRQFTDDFQLLAGHTYSKTVDDGSYDTEQPQDPSICAPSERSRSRASASGSR